MITVQHAMVQRSMCCSICQNVFKDPRILACGHTFCLTCLANQARSMKIPQCAVCQKSWPSPATSLLKNEAVASVCNILSAALSQNPILDCSLPSFNVIEQESSRSCSQHSDQKMICYCKSCAESLCPRCAVKFHNGHGSVEIADYCKELDQILLEKQNEHKTTEKSLEDQIGKLQAKRAEEASIVLSYDLLLSGYAKLADKVHAAKDAQSFSESCRLTRSLLPIAREYESHGRYNSATAHNDRNAALKAWKGNFIAGMSDCSLEPERDRPTTTTAADEASSKYSSVTFELCNDTSDVDETRTMSVYTVTEAEQQEDEIYYKLEVTSSTGTLASTAPSECSQHQLLKSGTVPAKSVQLFKFGGYRNAATTTGESRSANGSQSRPARTPLFDLFPNNKPNTPEDARNEIDLLPERQPKTSSMQVQEHANVSGVSRSGTNVQSQVTAIAKSATLPPNGNVKVKPILKRSSGSVGGVDYNPKP